MSCPLGLNCADMGVNPSGLGCQNKGRCCAIAQTLHDETHPDPDAIDALEYGNPYIECNYEQGREPYWEVSYRKSLPAGYAVAQSARLPWLENTIICEAQHYCVICQDHVYEENFSACDCNHIHYSNSLSSWGGCGYAEEDFSEEYRVSLGKIHPSARKQLKKLLEAKDTYNLWLFGHGLCGDELDPAAVWIKSLDEDTPDAIAQTLIWLNDYSRRA